jgi:CRISPR-associated endoribonuclease Cas2
MASRNPSSRMRCRPLCQSVLPSDFSLAEPSVSTSVPPAASPSPDRPDWFPALNPTASDLSGHRCGARQMLTLVAYDITDPKRLHRAARVCEDWGMRIQYSVFECRLDADAFDRFWANLIAVVNPKEDRVVAYKICTRCAREIHSHGVQVHNEKVVAYVC